MLNLYRILATTITHNPKIKLRKPIAIPKWQLWYERIAAQKFPYELDELAKLHDITMMLHN